jgi:mannose-6-phosphate isomerase
MRDFLCFQPIYQERVWGGRALESTLHRPLPGTGPIGESWDLVDRPEAQSIIAQGVWKGLTLRAVLAAHAEEVMGPKWDPARPFPLLIKWLDCRERLSLQVHPPAAVAPELGGEPKTENWYIAAATPGAQLIVGLRPGANPEGFERAVGEGTLHELVHSFPVSAGDSILVQSGEVHAIDGGNLILEIQQNSDTTYRVYDWGRVGLDGKPRQMHLPQSLRSINWSSPPPSPVRASTENAVIADCPEFRIQRVNLSAGDTFSLGRNEEPRVVSVVAGNLVADAAALPKGANVLTTYAGRFEGQAQDACQLLVTDRFSGT